MTLSSLGSSVPPFTPHAISVSLPTWKDNVEYEQGSKRVVDAMVNGYPRFFIHLSIRKLSTICEQKFGVKGERCLLFPTKRIAEQCRSFMQDHSSQSIQPRLIHLLICPEDSGIVNLTIDSSSPAVSSASADLHIVLFPGDAFPLAKQFWQHTGQGISSRLAEHCLSMLPESIPSSLPPSPTSARFPTKGPNRHYGVKGIKPSSPNHPEFIPITEKKAVAVGENANPDSVYLEERYGRNLPLTSAADAKRAMRRRLAGVLLRDSPEDCPGGPCAGAHDLEVGPSSRGVSEVSENDVFLFSTGMAAVWNAHQLALAVLPPAKSVCFGFPYIDTLKLLEKWGPGCYFLGHGLDTDIDELEHILATEFARDPSTPPALALFTEFPSNPLLRSANLPRLRALADQYDFLIVIDETLGNLVNVEILPYADILVSSLSKIFSGDANVMGGSLVLNPKGRHYSELKAHLTSTYEDAYFNEDAIYMERNSRDFTRRTRVINDNTEAVCEFLRARSLAAAGASPSSGTIIKEVFYPKWTTRENYEHCRIKGSPALTSDGGSGEGGFGGLFSLTFTSLLGSQVFFDALQCHKGPSLGTNFTLASPFAILAHYAELEWAEGYGVEEGLVRVSVGMEETGKLLGVFEEALGKAEEAVGRVDGEEKQ